MQIIEQKDKFRTALITWYDQEKRDLPWRRTENPYYIWISEVMLQQTRVETVIPYYERFIAQFPTMEALANASENDLLKMWEGLGYYSRARNLQTGVREVLEIYGGEIPSNRKDISTLKGVGPYTAGAVLSIAFGVPEHAVDGNVMRVLSRILLIEEDIAVPKTKKIFEQVVMDLIDPNNPSAFNQALMELGATICTPRPRCLLCPVREFCTAFEQGSQNELPVKSKKTKMKITPIQMFALQNTNGEWLLRKRPSKGLLAGMWEFPMIENPKQQDPKQSVLDHFGIQLAHCKQQAPLTHVFSHLTWVMENYQGVILEIEQLPDEYKFFKSEEVEQLPKPVPVLKIWEKIKNK